MKQLVVLFCVTTLCRAQFQSQFGFGSGGYSPFQQFGRFGGNSGFDLFSSPNNLNNNFFGQPSRNTFGSYSGFPFTNGQSNSNNFNFQQPSQFNIPPAPQQTYQQPSLYNPTQPRSPAFQTNPPLNQFQSQVSHNPPSAPPAYQPPQQVYQPPQQNYQHAQQTYQPPPAYQPPRNTQPRAAPFINTAQLSYNAAAPAQAAPSLSSNGPTTERPSVYHPPAPVHYVSIGQKLEGDYKFGYETGKGSNGDQSFRSETRDADGTVRGSYGYVDSSGKQITVHYEAGREGFKILSEDEAKNGKRPSSTPQQQQPAFSPPAIQPAAPEPATQPPAPQPSEPAPQEAGRRRKRRPNQA